MVRSGDDRWMPDADSRLLDRIREGIEAMPLNRLLGVRLPAMRAGRARAELAGEERVANHVGGMHAAAQYALVEAACGAAATSAFVDLVGRALPLAQRVELTFRRAATGDCSAEALVDPDEAERARSLVGDGQDAAFSVVCEVRDAAGEVTASAVMRWILRAADG
jgi:acyl-coenzyme A thioesterase PaaI-like protein